MRPRSARRVASWRLAACAACLASTATAFAQHQSSSATSTAAAASGQTVYEPGDIHPGNSRVYVYVGKTGLGHEHAVVGQVQQGRVRLDMPQNSGKIIFNMASFAADADVARQYIGLSGTTDASTQQEVSANMLGQSVLDVAHYPTASFQIKSIERLSQSSQRGLPQYQLNGDFTLHGATQPIQVVADAEEQSGWIHLRGGFTMLQTQYGIKPFAKAFGALGVTDQLQVWGDFWLAKDRQIAQQTTGARR